MAELGVHRILLLVVSLTKCLEGTKLLSNLKKCGDLECETLISRVLAMSDYRGPDCLYLNFTKGEEISVYVKLAGEREDLWAGSKGKDFGYFPRDAVQIEEVFISEEVEIPTKESDFLCLLGVSYMFENEDNELSDNSENIYPYEEDDEQKSYVHENDFHLEPGFYATSESTVFEDQFSASEAPEDTRSMSKSKEWVEVEAESVEQDHIPEVDHVILPTAVPEGKGWFGLGKEHTEEMSFESTVEPTQESSFLGRKIAMEDENEREELSNGDLQTEHAQEPESEFDSVPKEQSELASESEHILKPPDTGWFGGGFTSYLGFGDEDTGLEVLPKESNPPLQDVPSSISSIEESTVPCTEILPEKEDPVINDSSILQSSWFDYGFGMLGFAYASEDKIKSDGGQHEGDAGRDEHEPPLASDFDPDKEQEIKMIDSIETEDQINEKVLEETDDSDTLPYFKKFLNNFGNPWSSRKNPKETELQSPQQTLDQKNAVANDETEEFSVENYPTDVVSKTELPIAIHEEAHFKTSSSNNNDETSKLSVDTEVMAHMETDNSVDDTLLNSQMVATENSLLAQKYFPQKAEDASKFPMLRYLFQVLYDFVNSAFSSIVTLTEMVSWPFKYFAIMYLFY